MDAKPESKDLVLGIVGAGAMGRGIAQIAALAGIRVLLYDSREEAIPEAIGFVRKMIMRLVEKGKLAAADAEASIERLQAADGIAALAPCQVVIEAVIEDLQVKRDLFRELESVVSPQCLLATNTSSLSVTAIAAACGEPGRVGGFHFFNPVPLMKVVEVIDGLLTESWVGQTLTDLARRMGHTPVRAQDTPGFIVNHAGRGFVTEAFRLLGESVAEFYEIDRILREAAGFRMGPFELMDLTGLDVTHPVIESIYHQYYQEPRYRPSPLARQRVTAGVLGRKTGRGFYTYADGKAEPLPGPPPSADRPASVWVSAADPAARDAICALVKSLGAKLDQDATPGPESLCLVAPLGEDATTAALAENLDPARTVAIDTLFGFEKRRTLMLTPLTSQATRAAAQGLLGSDGAPVSVIRDSAGFVSQRVIATIVNIGCDMAQQGVATPEDIDRAVTLGLGYPMGPLAFGDALGAARILAILQNMFGYYGDPRYRPSPWLTRRARLGVSLLTPEP
jgi:3-hydroxybutyryl-CoA dehydrogenase